MARRTVGRALKMGVAKTAITAARDHHPLTHSAEVRQQCLAVFRVDLRSGRHLKHDVLAAHAVAILAHASATVLGFEVLLVAVVYKRIEALDGLYDHVASFTAIASVRSAELDEFLPPERHTAVPAVARADINLGLIEKLHAARYAIAGAKYETSARGAARATGNQPPNSGSDDGEVSVGRGQGGPCLTDAAQEAAPDATVRQVHRYASARTLPRRSSRLK